MPDFRFDATLWRWQGNAAWHFVTLPHDVADDIEDLAAPGGRGFGSVRVQVTVGETTWQTSLFPDSKAKSYVLPVKRGVRDTEDLTEGDHVHLAILLLDR